jgi:hypothetical protein
MRETMAVCTNAKILLIRKKNATISELRASAKVYSFKSYKVILSCLRQFDAR